MSAVAQQSLKLLSEKAGKSDAEADKIACIKTVIVLVYVLTNLCSVAGIIRYW